MAAKVKIELSHDGIRQLLCSGEVGAVVLSNAQRIKDAAGAGFKVGNEYIAGGSKFPDNQGRVARSVYTASYDASYQEAVEHTLYGAVMECKS